MKKSRIPQRERNIKNLIDIELEDQKKPLSEKELGKVVGGGSTYVRPRDN